MDIYTDRDLRSDVVNVMDVGMEPSTLDKIVENLRVWGVEQTGHVVPVKDIPDQIFWKVVFREVTG